MNEVWTTVLSGLDNSKNTSNFYFVFIWEGWKMIKIDIMTLNWCAWSLNNNFYEPTTYFLVTFKIFVFFFLIIIWQFLVSYRIIYQPLFNFTSTIGLIKNASLWTPVHIQTWLKNICSTRTFNLWYMAEMM